MSGQPPPPGNWGLDVEPSTRPLSRRQTWSLLVLGITLGAVVGVVIAVIVLPRESSYESNSAWNQFADAPDALVVLISIGGGFVGLIVTAVWAMIYNERALVGPPQRSRRHEPRGFEVRPASDARASAEKSENRRNSVTR